MSVRKHFLHDTSWLGWPNGYHSHLASRRATCVCACPLKQANWNSQFSSTIAFSRVWVWLSTAQNDIWCNTSIARNGEQDSAVPPWARLAAPELSYFVLFFFFFPLTLEKKLIIDWSVVPLWGEIKTGRISSTGTIVTRMLCQCWLNFLRYWWLIICMTFSSLVHLINI